MSATGSPSPPPSPPAASPASPPSPAAEGGGGEVCRGSSLLPSQLGNVTSLLLQHGYDVNGWKRLGLCSDQYLQYIQPVWATFDAPPYSYHLAVAAFHAIMMLLGCAGNLFVIVVFVRNRKLRRPSNLLLLNLAVSDFIMVLKSITIIINSLFGGPVLGIIGCQLYGFSTTVTAVNSIMTLALIADDRRQVICNPLDLLHQLTRRQVYHRILSLWAYSLVLSILPLLGISGIRFVPEGFLTSCSFDYMSEDIANKIFILGFFAAAWIIPCSRICTAYYRIVLTVRTTAVEGRQEAVERHRSGTRTGSNRRRQLEMRLAKMVGAVVLLWFIAWTPYAIVTLMGVLGLRSCVFPLLTMIPGVICKAAACLNPFIYSISHPHFLNILKRSWLVRSCACRCLRRPPLPGGLVQALTVIHTLPERGYSRPSDAGTATQPGSPNCVISARCHGDSMFVVKRSSSLSTLTIALLPKPRGKQPSECFF